MNFVEFVRENKASLLQGWFEWILSNYPEPSRKYILNKDAPFTNPIGYNVYNCLLKILETIHEANFSSLEFERAIEGILKIRTLEGLDPWTSVNIFEYLWKRYCEQSINCSDINDVIQSFDFYEKLVAVSLKKYVEIKERIAEIQKNEIRNRYGKILDRLNEKYSLLKDETNE
ncbi:MAG: RsbRD N-terminal domain-containing protein [Ignavibacteria bacterium]|nr:RsbRD N-terminal domain-containing protein [Ignavibacteria bacterium]